MPNKKEIKKQLKVISSAIDLIKMSQRSQHTSIKETLRKMLRCISMLADVDIEKVKVTVNPSLAAGALDRARQLIKDRKEKKEKSEPDSKEAPEEVDNE